MAKKFNLGDKVTHDFSGGVGRVTGLRVAKPYTVKVTWEGEDRKDWYKPEVLEHLKPQDENTQAS